jgi:arylsulfatase A-like enzyme
MDALDRLDYSRDTLVIFNTDHGISNKRAKGTLYDRGTEIALLVRPPRDLAEPRGRRVSHLIQNIDYLPTVCEAAGTDIPGQAQGNSFWPLIQGRDADYQPNEEIFIERNFHGESPLDPTPDSPEYEDVYDPVRSIRTDDFHFIRWFDPGIKPAPPLFWETGEDARPRVTEELYHTRLDPLETVNVAQRPEYRQVRDKLNQRLQKWMEDTGDFALTGDVPTRPREPGWGAWHLDE